MSKKIGFLSFGHWTESAGSQVHSAADSLLQSVELAVAAEKLGADGAFFRVHHFARQLSSPFPLLAAVGARTRKIEIGTADPQYSQAERPARSRGAPQLAQFTAPNCCLNSSTCLRESARIKLFSFKKSKNVMNLPCGSHRQ